MERPEPNSGPEDSKAVNASGSDYHTVGDNGALSEAATLDGYYPVKGVVAEHEDDMASCSFEPGEVLRPRGEFRWDIFSDSNFIKDRFDENPEQEGMTLELVCPLGGDRLMDPVRTGNCRHLEVFDLKNLIPVLAGGSLCPHCGERANQIETSEVFSTILEITSAKSVTFYRDGSWDPGESCVLAGDAIGAGSSSERGSGPDDIQPQIAGESSNDENGNNLRDSVMHHVARKWKLTINAFSVRNGTIANFRKRRLRKAGHLLIGRSLLERNESPLHQLHDKVIQHRRGRKRKRTREEIEVFMDQCIKDVVARKTMDLDQDYELGIQRRKKQYDQSVLHLQAQQQFETIQGHARRVVYPQNQPTMSEYLRLKHDRQRRQLHFDYQRENLRWEASYLHQRPCLEGDIRKNVIHDSRASVSPNKHGVDDIIPAVFCGGSEKNVRITYLPIDCVEAISKENSAYHKAYGMDDKVTPRNY